VHLLTCGFQLLSELVSYSRILSKEQHDQIVSVILGGLKTQPPNGNITAPHTMALFTTCIHAISVCNAEMSLGAHVREILSSLSRFVCHLPLIVLEVPASHCIYPLLLLFRF